MDIISHIIWGETIIRNKELIVPIGVASALPDLLGEIPNAFSRIFNFRRLKLKVFDFNFVPNKISLVVYWLFHSLISWIIFSGILCFFFRSYLVISFAYLSHILIDIRTHGNPWVTKIFYPFSQFHFRNRNWWEDKRMIFLNLFLLLTINFLFWLF